MKLDEKNFKNNNALNELEEDFKSFKNEINDKINNFDKRQEAQLESIKAILDGIAKQRQKPIVGNYIFVILEPISWKDAISSSIKKNPPKSEEVKPVSPNRRSTLLNLKNDSEDTKLKNILNPIPEEKDEVKQRNDKKENTAKDKRRSTVKKETKKEPKKTDSDEELDNQIKKYDDENKKIEEDLRRPRDNTIKNDNKNQNEEDKKPNDDDKKKVENEENKKPDKKEETIPYKRPTKSKEKKKDDQRYKRSKSPTNKLDKNDNKKPNFKKGTKRNQS